MISHLEDLPNELLLDLFSYLSPIDVFISFAYIDKRFNSILCDQIDSNWNSNNQS